MATTFKVGLTGGLASGKSTVARLLAEHGATVVDADRLVAELYAPGAEGAQVVADLFGPTTLTTDGAVDKPRLAQKIFSDPDARARLEAAIHPLVRRRFEQVAARTPGVVVLEATLLVEAGYRPSFDCVVTVEADPELRLRRAIARGLPAAEARARLVAQGDGGQRRAAADHVIHNDGDPAELARQVAALWQTWTGQDQR